MLKRDFPEDTPVFNILAKGNTITTGYVYRKGKR